jgi:hypothetical protein
MSLRTRLMLTVILAVFLGCHAYVAFMVLPAAYTDWQKSDLTQIGDQDRRTDECCLYLICDRTASMCRSSIDSRFPGRAHSAQGGWARTHPHGGLAPPDAS